MRKHLRYLILLLILFFVAANEAVNKLYSRSWEIPLLVHVFAIDGDQRDATSRYIASLRQEHFERIEEFVNAEGRRHGLDIDAVEVVYRGRLSSGPPQPPSGRSVLENVWWSLKFRSWAFARRWNDDSLTGDVELFVNYYDTATSKSLRHSVGLQGGLIGIINAFADSSYRGSNQVVIVHELMHTLGATDKYGDGNLPAFPEGYAEPYRVPLYPQRAAEIMGGRIPLSQNQARIPESLREVIIGIHTAAEIHWPIP
jgi:hypothetical protein